jgi:hypothetical protein
MARVIPVTVTEPRCPLCGSTFTIDPHAETEIPTYRYTPGAMPRIEHVRVTVPVAFCNGCEHVIQLGR